MDNLKIGILRSTRRSWVLGPVPRVVAALSAGLLAGCAGPAAASVPRRVLVGAAVVGPAGSTTTSGRNDARLGTPRQPFARPVAEGFSTVDDRQWIVNGRPFVDFESRTRSATRFTR